MRRMIRMTEAFRDSGARMREWRGRSLLTAAAIAFAVGSIASADTPVALTASAQLQTRWHAVKWPFLRDAWGEGLAYECPAEACGAQLRVYVRAKIGFCDCARGVADDDEVDRVGDLVLLGDDFVAAGQGRAITVGDMRGRSRRYVVATREGKLPALAVAFAANCNVAVATVVGGDAMLSDAAAESALAFVQSRRVAEWAAERLGS